MIQAETTNVIGVFISSRIDKNNWTCYNGETQRDVNPTTGIPSVT